MNYLGLLYICVFSGFVMVVGSLLLIWKGRIVVDRESRQVEEIELPGFKLRTQRPIVVMFFFGVFLLTMPIYVIKNTLNNIPRVVLTGRVESDGVHIDSIKAYAIIADCDVTDEVNLSLPVLENTIYRVKYYDKKSFIFDQVVDLSKAVDGKYELPPFKLTNLPRQAASAVSLPIKPAEFVKESVSVVADFK